MLQTHKDGEAGRVLRSESMGVDGHYASEILWPWVLSIPDHRAGRPVPGISYTPPGLPRPVFKHRPASSPGRRARQADQAAAFGHTFGSDRSVQCLLLPVLLFLKVVVLGRVISV